VDQDPTDEPASVLLERIRAERESAPSTRRRTASSRARETSPSPCPVQPST
jgi:type I restriction enzyme S subunit